MDTKKIGKFLRDLRQEQNLTQEELGEKLGATNKTISRWETGTYMPPADILLQLSKLYGVSVNEILCGERLATSNYQTKAEENIVTTLNSETKALKNRKMTLIICLAVLLVLIIANAIVIASFAFKDESYTVIFDTDGEVDYLSIYNTHFNLVNSDNNRYVYRFHIANEDEYRYNYVGATGKGYHLTQPNIAMKNRSLVGWYTSLDESGKKWNFDSDIIDDDITLYAKWEEATEGLSYQRYSDTFGDKTGYAVTGTQIMFMYGTKNIVIPSYYNGEPVLAITRNAFEWKLFIESVFVPDTVIEISDSAFHGCASLKSVRLSNNLEYIGDNAFEGCESLRKIDLPDGLKTIGPNAFSGCKMLQTLVVPNSVEKIYEYAFGGCYDLTSVMLGSRLKVLSIDAFKGCYNLIEVHNLSWHFNSAYVQQLFPNAIDIYNSSSETTKLYLDEGNFLFYDYDGAPQLVKYYGDESVITLPQDCNGKPYTIKDYAFYNNEYLQEITIRGAESIGEHAFAGSKITKVTLDDGVRTIGEDAFYNCANLEQVYMSDYSVERIEAYAFSNCVRLNNVTFSKNLKEISSNVFKDCINLYEINLPGSIESISAFAFANCRLWRLTMEQGNGKYRVEGNCLIRIDSKSLIYACGEAVIPSDGSVTVIESYAFEGNRYIKEINIPAYIEKISSSAFRDCPLLEKITVDENSPYFKAIDNCIISIADRAIILLWRNAVIPDDGSVTKIANGAVLYGSATIEIPKCVTQIEANAFYASGIRLKYDGTMKECAENTEYGKDVTKLKNVVCIECTDGELSDKWVEDDTPDETSTPN